MKKVAQKRFYRNLLGKAVYIVVNYLKTLLLVVVIFSISLFCWAGYAIYKIVDKYDQEKKEMQKIEKSLDKIENELYNTKQNLRRIKNHYESQYYLVDVKVTSYSKNDGYTPGVIMANGEHVREGAVAYNDVPLGTIIEIDGIKYEVCDRVAYDGVVDIYRDSIEECLKHGVQYKTIKVYKKEMLK